jgi:hypothetical protein
MSHSRKAVQARESLLAIMIILSAIIIETAYTASPAWYWLLLLNIPVIVLLSGKPKPMSTRVPRDYKKIKQVPWLQ